MWEETWISSLAWYVKLFNYFSFGNLLYLNCRLLLGLSLRWIFSHFFFLTRHRWLSCVAWKPDLWIFLCWQRFFLMFLSSQAIRLGDFMKLEKKMRKVLRNSKSLRTKCYIEIIEARLAKFSSHLTKNQGFQDVINFVTVPSLFPCFERDKEVDPWSMSFLYCCHGN